MKAFRYSLMRPAAYCAFTPESFMPCVHASSCALADCACCSISDSGLVIASVALFTALIAESAVDAFCNPSSVVTSNESKNCEMPAFEKTCWATAVIWLRMSLAASSSRSSAMPSSHHWKFHDASETPRPADHVEVSRPDSAFWRICSGNAPAISRRLPAVWLATWAIPCANGSASDFPARSYQAPPIKASMYVC